RVHPRRYCGPGGASTRGGCLGWLEVDDRAAVRGPVERLDGTRLAERIGATQERRALAADRRVHVLELELVRVGRGHRDPLAVEEQLAARRVPWVRQVQRRVAADDLEAL